MNLSRLRLITFDVTDTLLKFRSSPGRQYGEIGALYGVLADDNALAANFKAHWYKLNKEHPNFGLTTGLGWENWWKHIIAGTFQDSKFNINDKKLDAISKHLIDLYRTSNCWQQCFGTLGLLTYLRSKKVPLGIISNFDPRLTQTLQNTKLLPHFGFVITSYEVGFEKPDKRIFEEAMKASGIKDLKPEECLHIGDTPILDYFGAKNCGWNAILVHDKSYEQLKEKYGDVDRERVFASLYDLHKHFVDTSDEKFVKVESNL